MIHSIRLVIQNGNSLTMMLSVSPTIFFPGKWLAPRYYLFRSSIYFLEIFQWSELKQCVPFTSYPKFPELFGTETGRYSQIPRLNRLCPTCGSNQIQDEIHLLFHCPKYSIFRDRFYRKIEYHLPKMKRLSTLEAKKELMNFDNYFANVQLMRFILSCLNVRNNLLTIQTDVT